MSLSVRRMPKSFPGAIKSGAISITIRKAQRVIIKVKRKISERHDQNVPASPSLSIIRIETDFSPTLISDLFMSIIDLKATTVVGIIHNGEAAIAGDGQATMKDTVMKATVNKVRRLYEGKIAAGFAGSTADAFTLFEKYEEKLKQYNGNLQRAAVEMAKEWRNDKFLRKLEALLIV